MKWLYLAILGVGLVWGAVQGVQAGRDPASTFGDVARWATTPVVSGLGVCAFCVIAEFWYAVFKQSRSQNSPAPKPAPDSNQPPNEETRIEIHEPDIDLVCVLRGDAAKDTEGRAKIGAVANHYASGDGK